MYSIRSFTRGEVMAAFAFAVALVSVVWVGAAAAAPTLPKTAAGATAAIVGRGVPSPTSFAFAGKTVFVGGGGTESGEHGALTGGGVYVLRGGKAVHVDGTSHVFGLAWRNGVLYGTSGPRLYAWSGWNGSTFAKTTVLYTGKPGFTGFSGLTFGPDGRLYTGVFLGAKDWQAGTTPLANDVVSLNPDGSDLRVVATGLRQPWQLVFPEGATSPLVSDLGQDTHAKNPPDALVVATPGSHFGFAGCNWTAATAAACAGATKPYVLFSPHTSPMGIATSGSAVYVAEFGKLRVVKLTPPAKSVTAEVTGLAAPPIALGIDDGTIYIGDSAGTIYKAELH
jgi:glucose/arabinose dehydrogenase